MLIHSIIAAIFIANSVNAGLSQSSLSKAIDGYEACDIDQLNAALPMTSKKLLKNFDHCLPQSDIRELKVNAPPKIWYVGKKVDIATRKKSALGFAAEFEGIEHNQFIAGDHIAFRYKILDMIGKGGQGFVFKVLDVKEGVELALKLETDTKQVMFSSAKSAGSVFSRGAVSNYESREYSDVPASELMSTVRPSGSVPARLDPMPAVPSSPCRMFRHKMPFDYAKVYADMNARASSGSITNAKHINVPRSTFMFKGQKVEVHNLMQSDLFTFIQNDLKHQISYEMIQKIVHDALLGLQCLHSQGICHMDVKAENFLVRITPSNPCSPLTMDLVLTDFGMSVMTEDAKTAKKYYPFGTFGYLAPELKSQQPFDTSADIYSLGTLLRLILTRTIVKMDKQEEKNILRLIKEMTAHVPEERITIGDALKAPLFYGYDPKFFNLDTAKSVDPKSLKPVMPSGMRVTGVAAPIDV